MGLRLIDNPLIRHKLNTIRDISTPPERLRCLVEEISLMCMPYLGEGLPTHVRRIRTPLMEGDFEFIDEGSIVLVCILRAGLPMLSGALKALPGASSGFLAIKRDEKSLISKLYYSRLPNIKGRYVILLDPMLATGGTFQLAMEEIGALGPRHVRSLHIVASPQGIEEVSRKYPDVDLYVISVDESLNSMGYIVPGVGDIGDRLFTGNL